MGKKGGGIGANVEKEKVMDESLMKKEEEQEERRLRNEINRESW